MERIRFARMTQDRDEVEIEEPEEQERKGQERPRDRAERDGTRRVLQLEVAVGTGLLAGAEGFGGIGLRGKRQHLGGV